LIVCLRVSVAEIVQAVSLASQRSKRRSTVCPAVAQSIGVSHHSESAEPGKSGKRPIKMPIRSGQVAILTRQVMRREAGAQ
jgi:hypothetical protein